VQSDAAATGTEDSGPAQGGIALDNAALRRRHDERSRGNGGRMPNRVCTADAASRRLRQSAVLNIRRQEGATRGESASVTSSPIARARARALCIPPALPHSLSLSLSLSLSARPRRSRCHGTGIGSESWTDIISVLATTPEHPAQARSRSSARDERIPAGIRAYLLVVSAPVP